AAVELTDEAGDLDAGADLRGAGRRECGPRPEQLRLGREVVGLHAGARLESEPLDRDDFLGVRDRGRECGDAGALGLKRRERLVQRGGELEPRELERGLRDAALSMGTVARGGADAAGEEGVPELDAALPQGAFVARAGRVLGEAPDRID